MSRSADLPQESVAKNEGVPCEVCNLLVGLGLLNKEFLDSEIPF